MKGWFSRQPLHRKLVLTSMFKTTVVLFAAMLALVVWDTWRFQRGALTDAGAFATMLADGARAGVAFDDPAAVTSTLETVRLRPQFELACVYTKEGRLLAPYERDPTLRCPPSQPEAGSWFLLAARAPIEHNGGVIGAVYVQRDWATMAERLKAATFASLSVLILAAAVMLIVSHRLYRTISTPIAQLAAAARHMGEPDYALPSITAPQDEVGELVKAFGAMDGRVRKAREDLESSNAALRREIEERRQVEAEREALLEREQQANRIKDEFLATVSHELRTPLNAIVGWARVLATGSPDPETLQRAAASLNRNAQAQVRVIDDLIDISRIVTGKLRVLSEPLDLRGVVESAVDAIRPAAVHAGIRLVLHLPHRPAIIKGDRDRLQQIAWNLLSNAVKFAPRGTVTVTLAENRETVTLTVADTGIGIAPDFMTHVFDRFRQADASATREHGGLGIGLAVVKELVDLHGGGIRAESEGPGMGAAFIVTFPCHVGQVRLENLEDAGPSLDGVSVLAVDDNRDALELLDRTLTLAGASVRMAESGAQALDLWRSGPSDVLLCDLAMPHMSGFQLLSEIRHIDEPLGRVTLAIAVSAHATEEAVASSIRAGFQMHIAKPLDPSRLIRAVNAARARV